MSDYYRDYLKAKGRRLELGEAPHSNREIQEAMLEGLEKHAKCETILPPEMAYELATAFRDLIDGEEPFLFQNQLKQAGNQQLSRTKIGAIEDACRYVALCRESRIKDKQFLRTVATNYEVTISTVSSWLRRYPVEIGPDTDTGLAIALMEFSGRYYRGKRSD